MSRLCFPTTKIQNHLGTAMRIVVLYTVGYLWALHLLNIPVTRGPVGTLRKNV